MNYEQEIKEIDSSVRLISKGHSKNHINFIKLKAKYAEKLMKMKKYEDAVKVYS